MGELIGNTIGSEVDLGLLGCVPGIPLSKFKGGRSAGGLEGWIRATRAFDRSDTAAQFGNWQCHTWTIDEIYTINEELG